MNHEENESDDDNMKFPGRGNVMSIHVPGKGRGWHAEEEYLRWWTRLGFLPVPNSEP